MEPEGFSAPPPNEASLDRGRHIITTAQFVRGAVVSDTVEDGREQDGSEPPSWSRISRQTCPEVFESCTGKGEE